MKKIMKFYSKYKEYLRIDLLMYAIMLVMILVYLIWFA